MSATLQLNRLALKAKLFRGFADATRLSILECLRKGEKTVAEIVSDTEQGQPNVSNHLGCLRDCGLVTAKREGRNVVYSIRNERITHLLEDADRILAEINEEIYKCTRYRG